MNKSQRFAPHRFAPHRFAPHRFAQRPQKNSTTNHNKEEPPRCGHVAVAGLTNAGKSTLVNTLVAHPVSIVHHKTQTTRATMRGIITENHKQVILMDLPGLHTTHLPRAGQHVIARQLIACDVIMVVVDTAALVADLDASSLLAQPPSVSAIEKMTSPRLTHLKALFTKIAKGGTLNTPIMLVLNKVDMVHPKSLLLNTASLLESMLINHDNNVKHPRSSGSVKDITNIQDHHQRALSHDTGIYDVGKGTGTGEDLQKQAHHKVNVYMLSAHNGDGVARLKRDLLLSMPQRPLIYPSHIATDSSHEVIAEEITRKVCLDWLHQELPYHLTVTTQEPWTHTANETLKERPKAKKPASKQKNVLHQLIVVDHPRYKALIIGKHGSTLGNIRNQAQREISSALGFNVQLFLHVTHHHRALDKIWTRNNSHHNSVLHQKLTTR